MILGTRCHALQVDLAVAAETLTHQQLVHLNCNGRHWPSTLDRFPQLPSLPQDFQDSALSYTLRSTGGTSTAPIARRSSKS